MHIVKFFKKILNWLIIILVIILIGYVGYRIYDAAVENAAKRVRAEVSKGIADTINPLKWPGKIFGGHKKKEGEE
jgi:predicted negative regulator of RcsB-dependent stress response